MEPESKFHAMVSCTKARDLRKVIKAEWILTGEDMFEYTGLDCLFILQNVRSRTSITSEVLATQK
jgi:hypothetical protein